MIKWAIIFAVIGLVAGALGFGGIAGGAMGIAKFLFVAAPSSPRCCSCSA